jgi:hypothetical protein
MTHQIYIRQWVEVGGIPYPEMGIEPDETDIEGEELDNSDLALDYFHAGWFDALFTEHLSEKLECDRIFDYLCGWYAQKYELEVALKNCQEGEF